VAAAGFFKYLSLLSTSPIGGGVQAVLNKLKYSTNRDGLNKLKKSGQASQRLGVEEENKRGISPAGRARPLFLGVYQLGF
jgi:hypothetical protein